MSRTEDKQWWSAWCRPEDSAHRCLHALMTEMKTQQNVLHENTRRLIAAYQWGYKGNSVHPEDDVPLDEAQSSFNHAANIINTNLCKIIKAKILPMPLTAGAGYLARARAAQLGRAIEGEFDENDVDQIKEDVGLDAMVTYHGAGAAKVFTREGRIRLEHVPIEDIRFDAAECRYRKPRNLFQVQRWDRYHAADVLSEDAGGKVNRELRKRIEDAPTARDVFSAARIANSADQIEVYEAWHLPSFCPEEGDKAKDHMGRHVIAIEGATILDEEWRRDSFPFQLYVPRKRRRSIWGLSMMFDLVGAQREYDELTARYQDANRRVAQNGIIAPKNANVNEKEFANKAMWFAEYDGQIPPTPFSMPAVSADSYAYRDGIVTGMLRSTGTSELAAQNQLPAGIQQASGRALLVFEDVESEKKLPEHREMERFHVGLAYLIIDEARDNVKRDPGYAARYRGKKGVDRIKWADVLQDRADFTLKVFPTSALSRYPSARFEQLLERFKLGALTVEQFRRLDDNPDLQAEDELQNADADIIDAKLDLIATKGVPAVAQSFDNLAMIIQRGGWFYNRRRVEEATGENDVPEDRMQLIREYIQSAEAKQDEMKAKEAASAPPAGPPMPGGPDPATMTPPDGGAAPPLPPMPPVNGVGNA